MENPARLSVVESLSGREVLVTGSTGFLGKVLLAMLLDQVPEIKKLYLVIRPQKNKSSLSRFEAMLNSHYVFAHLHEKYGPAMAQFLAPKVVILESSLESPNFGISGDMVETLSENLDLVIHCAGLVDFSPDIRDSLDANVTAALNAAEFCKQSKKAKLLHVSTCFVAGRRDGRIPEKVSYLETPSGKTFNAEKEYHYVLAEISKIENSISKDISLIERKRLIREQCKHYGMSRSTELGWSNTYTYSKSLAECLLLSRYPDLQFSIFRPSIVESSLTYPFPGWNEGFNTSGPLAYLLGTWLKYLPVAKGHPFDLIPVDIVCSSMLAVSAALLKNQAERVYQCGTSDLNMISVDRSSELTSLSYQKFYQRKGSTWVQRHIRSRWKIVPIGKKNHPFAVSSLTSFHEKLEHVFSRSPLRRIPGLKKPLRAGLESIQRNKRKLIQIQETLRLFKPFIQDHYQVYETQNLTQLNVVEESFKFNPKNISWPKYFLDIHMPGLRRWCFPIINRKSIDRYTPRVPLAMIEQSNTRDIQSLKRNA